MSRMKRILGDLERYSRTLSAIQPTITVGQHRRQQSATPDGQGTLTETTQYEERDLVSTFITVTVSI